MGRRGTKKGNLGDNVAGVVDTHRANQVIGFYLMIGLGKCVLTTNNTPCLISAGAHLMVNCRNGTGPTCINSMLASKRNPTCNQGIQPHICTEIAFVRLCGREIRYIPHLTPHNVFRVSI